MSKSNDEITEFQKTLRYILIPGLLLAFACWWFGYRLQTYFDSQMLKVDRGLTFTHVRITGKHTAKRKDIRRNYICWTYCYGKKHRYYRLCLRASWYRNGEITLKPNPPDPDTGYCYWKSQKLKPLTR